MTLLDRYLSGEHKLVYDEILALGDTAFNRKTYPDVEAVLVETFRRVSYNLDIIYKNLLAIHYNFKKDCKYDFEKPLLKPAAKVEKLLGRLDKTVKRKGHVPISLKCFYRAIGACNFGWDYDSDDNIPWEGADPIQICPLNDLLEEMLSDDEIEELGLSADYLIKDNISGGPQYSLEITKAQSVDGKFLNEEHDTTFIDFLRITFDNCGFSRASEVAALPDFAKFYADTKPLLLRI